MLRLFYYLKNRLNALRTVPSPQLLASYTGTHRRAYALGSLIYMF